MDAEGYEPCPAAVRLAQARHAHIYGARRAVLVQGADSLSGIPWRDVSSVAQARYICFLVPLDRTRSNARSCLALTL